ncbi:uncharacterized protein LOC106649341 isoform X4 [Trichogramma pretiosum]|uniref:uncharacterized protein LOC106649341 isoform X4 n=1 Tax=Trichogramma pretiosum TaxID=7493 RepID=UPI000C719776|nr:uncharacterized protein LOC106649341 isoform X4 [Trichogramma pretiosum]
MRLLLPQLPLLLLLLLSHGFATTEAGAIEHIDASQHQQQIGGVDGDDAPSREAGNTLDQVDKIGLPIYTTLNGSVTNLNEILPNIHLNRTKAFLNCSQGSMQVDLMFAEPFYGLAYANFDRFSACITKGRGANSARIELPLKGCGTVQDPPRVFTNNIVVRFHPAVEMDGDEVITIVCRYPPARAEKPGPLIAHRESTEPPPASGWNGFHLLLLICTLLFMALLLTGLSCSYVCLKRRPVSVIHRQTFAGSEITKISGSSALSRISMFDDFKIPRIIGTQQTYGSEAHLVVEQSDTLPSDYPSESHSEVDEERSLPVSSAGSYETKAFVHREVEQQRASSSLYSETINEVESTAEYREQQTRERVEPLVEPVVAPRRPEITTHEVDDVFLRTVTEKRTIEDIERHRRQITEYHAKQKELPNPKWDVTIRNYPQESGPSGPPEWENFSDVSSASNLTVTLDTASKPQEEPIVDEHIQPTFTIRAEMTSETEIIERWHNLERPLEPQFHNELSDEERTRWREIITTESTLRKLLTEAFIKEDFELIRKDVRYTDLFSPDAWDVIIRIVSYPERPPSISSSSNGKSGQRYKRGKGASGDWDNRSRRSSLPTLYEYENDVDGQEHLRQSTTVNVGGNRIRKLSSTTRGGSEADLRSMSEMTVRDFARMDRDDQTSLSSFEGDSLVRSLSQPSLARSGSEFTEHWGVQAPQHLPNWDEPSSTETTPRPVRREVSSFQESTAEATPDGGQIQRRVATYSEIQSSNTAGPSGVAAGPGAAAAATSSRHQRARWFQDDSEPEMQI